MYRVKVTTLETFRRYMAGVSTYDTEEKLIESIKGLFEGNDKTRVGGAYHKIIEGDFQLIGGEILAGNIIMTKQQAAAALAYSAEHPAKISEVMTDKIYETPRFGPVQVRGKIDIHEGLELRDAKLKFGRIIVQDFIDSCQHKFYLDIQQGIAFYYDVFEVRGFDKLQRVANGYRLPVKTQIVRQEPIAAHRYSGMEDDIDRLLHQFLDYIELRDLFTYLKPAINEDIIF